MLKVNEAIIVEGKYDKIKLSSIIDALIIEVNGFGIFKDKDKAQLIKILAETRGIIIMTDSDNAGMMIRNKIAEIAVNGKVFNAYIPEILGKEKRKPKPSSAGLLGVEGVSKQHIINALQKCGINATTLIDKENKITNYDLYRLGFSGNDNSSEFRKMLLKELKLPQNISKNNLLKILQHSITVNELEIISNKLRG